MRRWVHLLAGVAIVATVAHYATLEAVRHNQRPALEGWKSHDGPRPILRLSSRRAGGPSEPTDAGWAPNRDLLLESGAAPNDDPLDRLRRSGLI